MVRSVRRDSRIASAAARRSPRTRVRSDGLDGDVGAGAHREAEVGLGQRGGVVDAVADHRDDAALALQVGDRVDLVGRQHLGDHVLGVDADLGGDRARRRAALSPVSSTGPQAEPAELGDRLARWWVSRCRRRPAGRGPRRPSRPRSTVRPAASRGPLRPVPARCPGAAPTPGPARTPGRRRRRDRRRRRARPGPGWSRTPATGGRSPTRSRAPAAMAAAIGCSEASSSAPASRSSSVVVRAGRRRRTSTSAIRPVVTVPVLSSTMVSTRRVDSSTSGPLIRMPELRAAAGADQQRGRRGQPERARAGDDQHRDRGGERRLRVGAGAQPERPGSRPPGAMHDRARTPRRPGRRAAAPAPCRSGPRSTSRAIWASWVSAPTRVARTSSRPPAFTVAPVTGSPGPTSTGTDSPVSRLASTADEPSTHHAVGGDLLPGPDHEHVADGQLRRPGSAVSRPSRSTATSLAPRSSSARSAAPDRVLARASK